MILSSVLLFAALQAPQQAPAASLPPSPVVRVAVSPTPHQVIAGDTVRLSAKAYDASGRELSDVRIRFAQGGARFEGDVTPDGLVTSGSTGILPVSVVVSVPGSRPFVERVQVRMVPGPASAVQLAPKITKLVAGQSARVEATPVSKIGDVSLERVSWRSSAPNIARVDEFGIVTGMAAGRATITATAGQARATMPVEVIANTIASVEVTPARTEVRQGDVVRFRATVKDRGGATISGLTPAWSFSPGQGMIESDGAFVAYEPGIYTVTANYGVRTAQAVVRVEHRDVRRPLTVVGRLPRTAFTTEEVWIHPNGQVAYLGTGSGGDRLYVIDIRDPANPQVVDSLMANTRRVNDVMTTPDGKVLVHTREGAADRKNGIVIATLEDPMHPKVVAHFTEGVEGGVHSAFVYQQRHGTHVYATNNGTGALHIIDIGDPHNPREVAQWRTDWRPDAGRTLHDVDVQDGLAYLSYWNDGLVILDVGNGVKGGSPSNPQLVSQFKYDLNELYRDVEASSGPGFIRGTHTAWRHRNYVFIADEVFPARGVTGARDAAAGRAYGRLQVVDVSDMDNPRSVAWFEPEFGGVHNVWVAGDTLYIGAYNGGFRVFDVSGELRGDLRAQGREIGHLNTADMEGNTKNTAMTWGVVVKDGLAYVNDMYNGLWIVRIEPKSELVP
jgi:hypothetical protein